MILTTNFHQLKESNNSAHATNGGDGSGDQGGGNDHNKAPGTNIWKWHTVKMGASVVVTGLTHHWFISILKGALMTCMFVMKKMTMMPPLSRTRKDAVKGLVEPTSQSPVVEAEATL